ncbi:hypothetical protein AQS8620_03203 [Aquimixticola soesokkakensis]|uniref:DUF3775 domain-containing protein n=1 Tax=Aquimixticola soesokkakensis TaxID=1519096 RepID=A0A1Y5TR91_9RHOB|nr:DUF3775 domain-containing protein [Aquimixticola soesokkakensis]SLN68195.1 hypothetical protein AQS8620_03203 [Aquimixticola soesokkakensis]
MEISPSIVAHVIVRAREIDVKVGRWDEPGDAMESDAILEARATDATDQELREFMTSLNDDEKAELVAIMWIGRDTFTTDDWDEAVETAKGESGDTPTEDYLLGIPLLADYLEEGLNLLGIDPEEEEDELYR